MELKGWEPMLVYLDTSKRLPDDGYSLFIFIDVYFTVLVTNNLTLCAIPCPFLQNKLCCEAPKVPDCHPV